MQVKTQIYKQNADKQITGTALVSSKVDVSLQCAIICLANSCKAYNVITSDNNLFCDAFGDEQGTAVVENQHSVYYG